MTELSARIDTNSYDDEEVLIISDGRLYVGLLFPDIDIPPDIRKRLENKEKVRVDLVWKDE